MNMKVGRGWARVGAGSAGRVEGHSSILDDNKALFFIFLHKQSIVSIGLSL